jgi:hypothetical protein
MKKKHVYCTVCQKPCMCGMTLTDLLTCSCFVSGWMEDSSKERRGLSCIWYNTFVRLDKRHSMTCFVTSRNKKGSRPTSTHLLLPQLSTLSKSKTRVADSILHWMELLFGILLSKPTVLLINYSKA